MDSYPKAAMERAMKVQDVLLQAMAKKITWWQAAEILGISDRHMRRCRERYEEHQHLDGTLSITHGPHRLGHYTAQGAVLANAKMAARRAVEKTRGGKVIKPTFPPRLEIPPRTRDSHFPTAATTAGI